MHQVTVDVLGVLEEKLSQGFLKLLGYSVRPVKLRSCIFDFVELLVFFRKTVDESRHCTAVVWSSLKLLFFRYHGSGTFG